MPRRMKNSTTGLRPIARNIDITNRIRTEEMLRSCWDKKIATRAPSAPKNPMLKGVCRSSAAGGAVGSTGTYGAGVASSTTRSVASSIRSAMSAADCADSSAASAAASARSASSLTWSTAFSTTSGRGSAPTSAAASWVGIASRSRERQLRTRPR
jgi:hypothetical protein